MQVDARPGQDDACPFRSFSPFCRRRVLAQRDLRLLAQDRHRPLAGGMANQGLRVPLGGRENRSADRGPDALLVPLRFQRRQQRLSVRSRHRRSAAIGPVHPALSVQPGPRGPPDGRRVGAVSGRTGPLPPTAGTRIASAACGPSHSRPPFRTATRTWTKSTKSQSTDPPSAPRNRLGMGHVPVRFPPGLC